MTWQDAINGSFELLGAPFILVSVIKLYREKIVRGVSWTTVLFFTSWGLWNLYYYPHLGQWLSFAGGLAVFFANVAWVVLLVVYHRRPG